MREAVIMAATEDLWNWTGCRYSLCEVSIRPCAEDCGSRSTWQGWSGSPPGFYGGYGPWGGFFPYIYQGSWYNAACGTCGTQRCGCERLSTVVLPGPVYSVTSVYVDGELLNPTSYRLDNLGLSRIDGYAWPDCQSMKNSPVPGPDLDTSNTFMVTYLQGEPVPMGGRLALGALSCELAKLACGDKSCRLPKRATTVTREGVTVVMPGDTEMWKTGATGLWECDRFISSVNASAKRGYRVTSPDLRPLRRRFPSI